MTIKVGFLAAYDYGLLEHAIPLVYAAADQIVVCIDRDRRTWTGDSFRIEPAFFDWIDRLDHEHKIRIYEDAFYDRDKQPMENEVEQRNRLARFLGEGGWHVQLDVDEYFVNFPGFVERLRALDPHGDTTVLCRWLSLYKRVSGGFLYVGELTEQVPVATNRPHYEIGRWNETNERMLFEDFVVVHQSWARKDDEVRKKLASWGHSGDFDHESYFNLWRAVDRNNHRCMNDFHPIVPETWSCLRIAEADSIAELVGQAPSILRELGKAAPRQADEALPDVEEALWSQSLTTRIRGFFGR